jgi:hypothetical protein
MALFDDIRANYARLNDPAYVKQLISEQQTLHQPELEASYKRIDVDLNRRGMFSSSPVTRARYQATSEFNRGIAMNVQRDVSSQRAQIIPLLVQLELAEREGRRQDKAGIMKLIGTAIGAGAGIMVGGTSSQSGGAGSAYGDYNPAGATYV